MEIGGESFFVRVDGPDGAPPLVLSNSLGATHAMWDAQMPAFTREFRVIRYDSRGHGASPAAPGPYSIEQLGRDALAILDALGVAKAHWVGVSKGGMVGQWVLANAGARIDRAVLANTASHYNDPSAWNPRITTVLTKGMAPIVDGVLQRWFTPEFAAREPETIARAAAMLRAAPPPGYAACCSAIRDMDQREACRRIANPTLVIVGTRDLATPPALGRGIAERIPGAQLRELDAAHLSNIEQPEAFTHAVLAFLNGAAIATEAK